MIFIVLLCFTIQTVMTTDDQFHRNFYEKHFFINDNGRNAIKAAERKWPDGVVPYKFNDDYIERDRAAILSAMDIFRKETCIKFVLKRDNHSEYINFRKSSNGCGTLIGYRPNDINGIDVSLTEECLQKRGAIQHELLHVVGLWHEQSRPDRDDFVEIYWDNIQPSKLIILSFCKKIYQIFNF